MNVYSSDVAFTPAVKDIQARRGSRKAFTHREEAGSWPTRITPDLAAFIAAQTIAAAPIPAEGLGEAIRDRLKRAAAPR